MTEQQMDPTKCQEIDEAMHEQCMRLPGHEGPHDALGEPEMDPEPEEVMEPLEIPDPPQDAPQNQVIQGSRIVESATIPQEAPPTRVEIDLDLPPEHPNVVLNLTEKVHLATQNPAITGGERVDYAVGTAVMPNQQTGGLVPYLAVTLFLSGITLGSKMHATAMVDNFFLDQDAINGVVSSIMDTLLGARQQQAQQVRAAANGLIIGQN